MIRTGRRQLSAPWTFYSSGTGPRNAETDLEYLLHRRSGAMNGDWCLL